MNGNCSRWQSSTAALLALGIVATTVAPTFMATSASAQVFRQQPDRWDRQDRLERNRFGRLPAGTLIPATYRDAERIILKPDESLPLTLRVSRNVLSPRGMVLIPQGSEVRGRLEPVKGGTQFVARELLLRDGERLNISANSGLITRREEIDGKDSNKTRTILTGALVGGAAATVISAVAGEVGVWKSLAGAGAGALGGFLIGNRRSTEVVIVDPKTDLNLTLNSDLRVARAY